MNTNQLGSISSSDLIDAKLEEHQFCASKHCPGCGHKLEGKPDWVGLPAGVKFDPTDQELIEHLEAKVEAKQYSSKSHPLIDEFIPTIEGEDGICYTHPEKLPGVTRDGLSRHFFHRPSKAYTTGTRKRRKIQTECDLQGGETRWHKTGKTRPVMVNGKQKGCKKILVLYTNFGKNRKPEKTNWVMHQYHLGQNEEEREGELVVSKIFYQTQPRQCNWSERNTQATAATTVVVAPGEINSEPSSRRDSGSGSCSSSKEIIAQRDEFSGVTANAGVISSYGGMDLQQFKADHFGFTPFRKTFEEVGTGGGEASTAREGHVAGTCEAGDLQRPHHMTSTSSSALQLQHENPHHHQISTAYHVSRPSHSISAIVLSPPPPPLHHTSIILDDDSFHVSRLMLQNENLNFPIDSWHCQNNAWPVAAMHYERGLLEESTITNPQEADWLKYSTFWPDPDPDNPHHHHG
ncbi:hypothetical protein LguiA_020069 [Lonicera macranthoides]